MIVFHWPRIIFRWPQIRSMKTLLMTWIVDLDSVKRCDGWLQTWIYQGHDRVMSLNRVPGSCPWTFWHDCDDSGTRSGTRFRDMIVSCPWIVSLVLVPKLSGTIIVTTQGHVHGHNSGTRHDPGRQHNSCPWKFLKFQKWYVSFRDMFKGHDRDTIRDTIVSLSRGLKFQGQESCPWALSQGHDRRDTEQPSLNPCLGV